MIVAKHTASDVDNDWQPQADMRTLIDAEQIKKDKPRLKKAMARAKKDREALTNVMKGK